MKKLSIGQELSAEEIGRLLPADRGIVAVKQADESFRIFSQRPWRLDSEFELDNLRKNRTGANILYGESRVVCFPNSNFRRRDYGIPEH